MKTAGSLLQAKRLQKELSLEEVARAIKVKPEYLGALESSHYHELPSATATQGFLRNYARFLHLQPDPILAMYRRDYARVESGELLPPGLVSPLNPRRRFLTLNSLLAVFTLFGLLLFLIWQFLSWRGLPKLTLLSPREGEIYGEKITVKGTTDPGATVKVNDQLVLVDQNGQFTLDLLLPAGTHTVVVKAENRQGKSRLAKRSFQVSK